MYLGQFFQYTKSTKASYFEKDTKGTASNPIALHQQKAIYKIKADCPHCGQENSYTELLEDEKVPELGKKDQDAILTEVTLRNPGQNPLYAPQSREDGDIFNRSTIGSLQEFLRRIVGVRIKQYNLTKLISHGAFFFLISFTHPLFKNLKPLVGENKLVPFFVTGCQHCNKRIRVNIPLNNVNHRFNTIRGMLKIVLRLDRAQKT